VDLKETEGLEKIRKLAASVDVLIENMRRGALAKLGLGYEALKELNPGEDRPGYDLLIQGRRGIREITLAFELLPGEFRRLPSMLLFLVRRAIQARGLLRVVRSGPPRLPLLPHARGSTLELLDQLLGGEVVNAIRDEHRGMGSRRMF